MDKYKEPLEGTVRIKSNRVCHRKIKGEIGEIFGYHVTDYGYGKRSYGVSVNGKDYELWEHELEVISD